MRRTLILFLALLLLAPLYADKKKERVLTYDALIRSAKIYLGMRDTDFESAQDLLQQAIDNYDNPIEAHYLMAIIYAERTNYTKMMEHFGEYEKICAMADETENKKLKKRCKKDKMPKQIEKNKEAAWESSFNYGVQHLKMADSLSEAAKTVTSDSVKTFNETTATDLYARAETEFSDCILIDSSKYMAYTNLGLVYSRNDRKREAADLFLASYNLDQEDVGLIFNLASAFFELRNYDSAALFYDIAANANADSKINALFNLAVCYQASKKQDELKGVLDEILTLDPENEKIRYQRGFWYVQKASGRELGDSLSHLDSLQEASPQDKSIQSAKEELTAKRIGFYKSAMPDFKLAAEKAQTNAEYWYWYGISAYLSDDQETALLAYEKAVELEPESSDAWCELRYVYAKLKLQDKYDIAVAKCKELKGE